MELSVTKMALITLGILIGIMIISAFTLGGQFENPYTIVKEAPLEKNTKLQIKPGETYVYSYLFNDTQLNITYQIIDAGGCTGIRVLENIDNPGICIGEDGTDVSGSNATLQHPQIVLFKPWMLALHEGWKWNSSLFMVYGESVQHLADVNYRVIRTENYRGRTVFVVKEESSDAEPQYSWVDAEKRVLLKLQGKGYEITMTEGIELD